MAYKNKEDQRAAERRHYLKNKKKVLLRNKLRRLIVKEKYIKYKSTLECFECGYKFKGRESVGDFHHVDPATKKNTVGNMVSQGCGWDEIMTEINKCIVLCANCHRLLTEELRKAV